MSPARGGDVQTRSSRPRPATWCSATRTVALGGVLGRGGRELGVGRADLLDHLQRPPEAAVAGEGRRQGRHRRVRGRSRSDQRDEGVVGHSLTLRARDAPPNSRAPGSNVPDDIDIHTTAGKLADFERRVQEATHAGSERAVEKQHAAGKMTARERIDALLDPGSFTEFDEFARHRSTNFGMDDKRPFGDGVVTGYGTVDGRPGRDLLPGRHRVRRQPRRGLRREDRQGPRLRDDERLPGHRHQRGRRRAHPGGRGLPRPLRRDLPAQRARLRRHPADLAGDGPGRRRARLLPRAHRLRRHGRQDQPDVHHRPRRGEDRDRRGRHPRGARRRAHAQHQVRRRPLPRPRTRPTPSTTSRRCCPTCRATTSTRCRRSRSPRSTPCCPTR